MAKTLTELVTGASNICDETYSNAMWVAWFNSALDDLAPALFLNKSTTITQNTNGNFDIPADYISTIRIDGTATNMYQVDVTDDTSTGYKVLGKEIVLQGDDATSITLWYYRRPEYFTTTATNTPADVPDNAISAIEFYGAAMAMLYEDEGTRYEGYMTLYSTVRAKAMKANAKTAPMRTGQWVVYR